MTLKARRTRLDLIAPAVLQHDEAIAIAGCFLETGIRHDDAQLAFLVRGNKDIPHA